MKATKENIVNNSVVDGVKDISLTCNYSDDYYGDQMCSSVIAETDC